MICAANPCFHTAEVTSSNLVPPTIFFNILRAITRYQKNGFGAQLACKS